MTVLIIGSGISGTTAAAELTKNGVNVVMLEAQDRLGGRTYTVESNGRKYDIGASWMHETLVNPLFQQAAKMGVKMAYDDGPHNYYTRDGPVDSELRIPNVVEDILNSISLDYKEGEFKRDDVSIRDYALDFVNKWPLITEEQRRLVPRFVQKMEFWSATTWTKLPASSATLDGLGRNAYVIDGYETIYNWAYSQIDQSRAEIHKSTPVTSIQTGDGNEYVVTTPNGTFRASDIICTIPLGALSAELFKFDLPPRISYAIKNGCMGSLGKFFMEFEEEFWPHKNDRFNYIVDEDPEVDLPLKPGNHPLIFTCSMKDFSGPPVIAAQTAPPLTQYLEANPDKVFEFMKPALELIKKQGATVPQPSKIVGTSWSQNPYFNGTYSAMNMGESYKTVIEPFAEGAGRLRFAGEHTVVDGNGCVHGAYASGLREAKKVMGLVI